MFNFSATIAYQDERGYIHSIQSNQFDPDPSRLGSILQEHYSRKADIANLVDHGNVSAVGNSESLSTFYIRDLYQPAIDHNPKIYKGFVEYEHNPNLRNYNYLWIKGHWFVFEPNKKRIGWHKFA